jgi:hypothetical protein
MTAEHPVHGLIQQTITLNPAVVAQAAKQAATIAAHVVAITLKSIDENSKEPPRLSGSAMTEYQFALTDITDEERRQLYRNWILARGFHELTRGIRKMLEEAFLYIEVTTWKPMRTTRESLVKKIDSVQETAQRLTFPALFHSVNKKLGAPLEFEPSLRSMQATRNCLEHRGGRVGPKDIDPTTGVLVLTFPRAKTFYMRGVEEIELRPGERIDPRATDSLEPLSGEVEVYLKLVTETRTFSLDDPVNITDSDFVETAMACHMMADDLAIKLPQIPSGPTGRILG